MVSCLVLDFGLIILVGLFKVCFSCVWYFGFICGYVLYDLYFVVVCVNGWL